LNRQGGGCLGETIAHTIALKGLPRVAMHLGQEMLRYGIDRETYLTQAGSAGSLALCTR